MKRDWADGYVADITYSHGYFHELAPAYLRYCLLVNGIPTPSAGGPYTYCELGYGQGFSANIHAAANPRGEFWGTDFNPGHALQARSLAQQARLDAKWLDLSFEAMLDESMPSFDFIVLHGVWSWVSASAQHALVEFMRRKLKPGGAVFMSYNVLPGWNEERPLRDLLWLHTEHGSAPGAGTRARIAKALEFAQSLRKHGCAFFTDNARASRALDDMLRQDPGSLAHEYFNRSWWLTYFAEVERSLQAASLEFACSAHISDLAGEVRDRLSAASFLDHEVGVPLRETAADFILNRRFRRDIFVRGSLRMSAGQRMAALDEVKFVLARPIDEISMFVATPYGQIPLEETRARPLLEMLAAAPSPVPLAQLRSTPEFADWPAEDMVQMLTRLVTRRDVCPVFADDSARMKESKAAAINAAIARQAFDNDTFRNLASPVAGCGIETSRLQRFFWQAWQDRGARTAAELARAVQPFYEQAPKVAEELEVHAGHFVSALVPRWRALGLLEPASKSRK